MTPQNAVSGDFLSPNREIRLSPFKGRGHVVFLLSPVPEWCPLSGVCTSSNFLVNDGDVKTMALVTSSSVRSTPKVFIFAEM